MASRGKWFHLYTSYCHVCTCTQTQYTNTHNTRYTHTTRTLTQTSTPYILPDSNSHEHLPIDNIDILDFSYNSAGIDVDSISQESMDMDSMADFPSWNSDWAQVYPVTATPRLRLLLRTLYVSASLQSSSVFFLLPSLATYPVFISWFWSMLCLHGLSLPEFVCLYISYLWPSLTLISV